MHIEFVAIHTEVYFLLWTALAFVMWRLNATYVHDIFLHSLPLKRYNNQYRLRSIVK